MSADDVIRLMEAARKHNCCVAVEGHQVKITPNHVIAEMPKPRPAMQVLLDYYPVFDALARATDPSGEAAKKVQAAASLAAVVGAQPG